MLGMWIRRYAPDPHRDPHGETNGRSTWSKAFSTSSFLRQKRPQTLMPQRLEGFLSLGKDEVGGSNPPSSSKKHRKLRFSVLFCCKNVERSVGQNVGQPPDPHPDPHAEMRGKVERGADGYSVRSSFFRLAYITCAMKLPMVCAASSCFWRVAWV